MFGSFQTGVNTIYMRGYKMIVKKKGFCFIPVLFAVLLCGCASSPDKLLSKKDLESVNQIKIIRYESPGYMKDTTSSKVTATAVAAPFMVFGAVGGGIGGGLYASIRTRMMTTAGKEMQTKYDLPDFMELVHKDFSEKLLTNRPERSEVVVESGVVGKDFQDPSACLLKIEAVAIVGDGDGLQTRTEAQLVDPTNNVLWRKRVSYKSKDLGRTCAMGALEADNARLLREEIAFAVDKTVAELVDHFEGKTETKEAEQAQPKKTDEAAPAASTVK
jgi:hypothetical protein